MKSVLRRLLTEFWLPALAAIGWTSYNLYSRTESWDVRVALNIFAPTFFLASWATAQFFRVKKQTHVEGSLQKIEERASALVSKLEKHTKDFVGYSTGGESIVYFHPSIPSKRTFNLDLMNMSEYPAFDIQAELIDLDEATDPMNGKFWTRHRVNVASLYQSKAIMGAYSIDMTNRKRFRANIFIHTRTQGIVQQFHVVPNDGHFLVAFETKAGDSVVEREIPANFPGHDPSNPSKVFG